MGGLGSGERGRIRERRRRQRPRNIFGGVEGEERGGREAGSGDEAEAGEAGVGGVQARSTLVGGQGGDVDGRDAGSGVFDERREGLRDGKEGGPSFGFGPGMALTKQNGRIAGEGGRRGEAELDAAGAGEVGAGEHERAFTFAVEQGEGGVGELGFETEQGLQRKIGKTQDGEGGGRF